MCWRQLSTIFWVYPKLAARPPKILAIIRIISEQKNTWARSEHDEPTWYLPGSFMNWLIIWKKLVANRINMQHYWATKFAFMCQTDKTYRISWAKSTWPNIPVAYAPESVELSFLALLSGLMGSERGIFCERIIFQTWNLRTSGDRFGLSDRHRDGRTCTGLASLRTLGVH